MDNYIRPYAAIKIGTDWEDITSDVMGKDGKTGFNVKHGQLNQTSRVSYGSANIQLKNLANRFSPRNASSDLYGYLNRNLAFRMGLDHVQMNFGTPTVNSWGVSDANVSGNGVPGLPWSIIGLAASCDVAAGVGTIISDGTLLITAAVIGSYGDVEITAKMKVSSLTTDPEFGIIAQSQGANAGTRVFVDTSTDVLKITIATALGTTTYTGPSFIAAADTYYWFHVSVGKRIRSKVWADGTDKPEAWMHDVFNYDPFRNGANPLSGGVGPFIREGVAATTFLTVDEFDAFNPRMYGEVASWVPSADNTNQAKVTDIQVAGILRRMNVGEQQNLISPLRRLATLESTLQYAVGYWPCEDSAGATAPSSGLTGGSPMRVIGEQPNYAASNLISGSAPLMVMTTGGVSAILPALPSTANNVFYRHVMVHGDTEIANDAVICELYTTGTATRWTLVYVTGGSLRLRAYNLAGTLLHETGAIGFGVVPGTRFYVSIELVQNGVDVETLMATNKITDDGNDIIGNLLTETFAAMTIGACGGISVGLNGTLNGCAVGHIGVGNNQQFMFSTDALIGFAGERAATRMQRLCTENNLEFYLAGVDSDTVRLGPQVIGTLAANLQYAADTDQGIMYEPRNSLAVGYRTRTSLFQQPAVIVDYEGSYLDSQLTPTEDDALTANDVTAKRVNGGEARVVISTGPNNNQPPPNGIGVYSPNPPVEVTPMTDADLPDIAAFRAFVGTWDAARYPVLSFNLSRKQFTITNPALRSQVATLGEGDYLQIQNPPNWLPPEHIDVMTQGYTEEYGQLMWTRKLNTTPYGPYLVAITDEAGVRVSGGTDMVLAANTLAADTSLVSQSISGHQRWCRTDDDADSATDFPFDVMMSGERITVTAVNHGLRDTFTRTVAAGGLGTSDDGHVWAVTAGTASYWSVNGTTALCAVNGLNTEQHVTTDIEANFNQELRVYYLLPVTPTGAAINVGLLLRYTDANNYYWCDVQVQTTGVLTLRLIKRVAGVVTVLGTKDITGLAHSTVVARAIRAQSIGSKLRVMVFDPALTEQPSWQLTVTDSDFLGTTITKAGLICRLMTGNTNALPVTIQFDNLVAYSPQILTATRSVNGVSKFNGPGQVIEVLDRAYVGR